MSKEMYMSDFFRTLYNLKYRALVFFIVILSSVFWVIGHNSTAYKGRIVVEIGKLYNKTNSRFIIKLSDFKRMYHDGLTKCAFNREDGGAIVTITTSSISKEDVQLKLEDVINKEVVSRQKFYDAHVAKLNEKIIFENAMIESAEEVLSNKDMDSGSRWLIDLYRAKSEQRRNSLVENINDSFPTKIIENVTVWENVNRSKIYYIVAFSFLMTILFWVLSASSILFLKNRKF